MKRRLANEKYGALGDIDVSAFDKLAATFEPF